MDLTRARLAGTVAFAHNGFVLGFWIVNIPGILDRTDTSKAQLGVLLLLLGGSALVGMQAAGALIDRVGSRRVLGVAAGAMSLLVVGPAASTSTAALAVTLVLLGLANGAVDVAQNAHAADVERHYGRPIMTSFHAFYSAGGLLVSVVGGLLIAADVDLPVSASAVAVVGVLVVLWVVRGMLPPEPVQHDETPVGRPPWSRHVALLGLLAFVLLLAEGVAYDWSTVHLHETLDASKAVAAYAFGAFSVTMTIVRLVADRVVAAIGPGAYVRWAALLGALGLAGAALAPTVPLGIAAWALFGIGLAGCVPQFFTAAAAVDPRTAGVTMARVTGCGYLGLLAGPSVIGLLTGWVPLTTAFVVPLVGCVLASALAPRALRPVERASS
ncbi:hypothetical protein ASD11_13075 [Aeromicrobium sp. Root495]|uniref:MFS transporter n=1 Tax=Aeromicrobium sp. Root495 TaxID=1736550 RepID=UPI0006FF65C7|nr:MFS transporter [Aeromicrobium sp. Root495]KQY60376.1 hypothetical protein ASD11_13075 [Aeromicrobium sp. Root495]